MKQRKMNLAAFVVAGPVSGHHGGWRYPTADRNLLSLEYYRNVGRILEDGRFDLIFFADILAIPNRYEGKLDSQLRYGALGSLRLELLPDAVELGPETGEKQRGKRAGERRG